MAPNTPNVLAVLRTANFTVVAGFSMEIAALVFFLISSAVRLCYELDFTKTI